MQVYVVLEVHTPPDEQLSVMHISETEGIGYAYVIGAFSTPELAQAFVETKKQKVIDDYREDALLYDEDEDQPPKEWGSYYEEFYGRFNIEELELDKV